MRGREISFERSFRVSPFGNSDANEWYARLPHYHRRVLDDTGQAVEGRRIEQHRPWQKW